MQNTKKCTRFREKSPEKNDTINQPKNKHLHRSAICAMARRNPGARAKRINALPKFGFIKFSKLTLENRNCTSRPN